MKHELAYTGLANQLIYQLIQIGILYNGLLLNMARGRCSSLNSFIEADTTYKPKCRNHRIDWLILVFESELFKELACPRIDA